LSAASASPADATAMTEAPHRFQRSLEQRARVSLVVNDEQAQPFKFRRAVKGRVAARRTLRTS